MVRRSERTLDASDGVGQDVLLELGVSELLLDVGDDSPDELLLLELALLGLVPDVGIEDGPDLVPDGGALLEPERFVLKLGRLLRCDRPGLSGCSSDKGLQTRRRRTLDIAKRFLVMSTTSFISPTASIRVLTASVCSIRDALRISFVFCRRNRGPISLSDPRLPAADEAGDAPRCGYQPIRCTAGGCSCPEA